MKLLFAIALLTILSCNNAEKKETMSMPGAYNMLSQSVSDGKTDTSYTDLKQLKIYTDDYMMYANMNPADSVSAFGIGSYSADTGTVIENVVYNASDTSENTNPGNFTVLIEKTAKGNTQVLPEIEYQGQKWKLTEEYESAGTSAKSPLDGAWKEIKSYTIKGKDTTIQKMTQYKTYFAGHFMFGHTYRDSANKLHTGIGYGTFEMNGANKVKEKVTTSTYYQIRGQSFDIDIEMNGADEFKQTITDTTGDRTVEVYTRMKK